MSSHRHFERVIALVAAELQEGYIAEIHHEGTEHLLKTASLAGLPIPKVSTIHTINIGTCQPAHQINEVNGIACQTPTTTGNPHPQDRRATGKQLDFDPLMPCHQPSRRINPHLGLTLQGLLNLLNLLTALSQHLLQNPGTHIMQSRDCGYHFCTAMGRCINDAKINWIFTFRD